MWDEERDREMMRNQMIAIVLMMFLLMAWYYFYAPQPPALPPAVPGSEFGPLAAEPPPEPVPTPQSAPEARPDAWPHLPEIPAQDDRSTDEVRSMDEVRSTDEVRSMDEVRSTDEVTIGDAALELTFTRIGGRLKRAAVLEAATGLVDVQLVKQFPGVPDSDAVYPLGLHFSEQRILDEIDRRRFEAKIDQDGRGVVFTLELPNTATIEKRFRLDDDAAHMLLAEIVYLNREDRVRVLGMDATPAYILNWGPSVDTGDDGRYAKPSFVWRKDFETLTLLPEELPVNNGIAEAMWFPGSEWFGFKGKYFMTAFRPEFAGSQGWAQGTGEAFRFGLTAPRFETAPGAAHTNTFRVYLGPMHLSSLKGAWDTLPTALTFFTMFETMDWFAKFLLGVLNWFHDSIFANYGIAIILLTVLVRAIMFPLTLKSMRSMKRMQALAPEVKALQEKYKDDKQEASAKMMELYRERGVNPLGGCFPMLLQMPIFIALYRMLWNAFELRGAPFLWVGDLSKPDHLFHMPFMTSIPLVGSHLEYFNLLPILMGIAMVVSVKIMPTSGPAQNPQQQMIMTMMPIMFSVFCYPLAAGLNLYVLTSTVLGMVQQHFVRANVKPGGEPSKKSDSDTPKKRKRSDIYGRAKQRQREMAKEAKKRKKGNRKISAK